MRCRPPGRCRWVPAVAAYVYHSSRCTCQLPLWSDLPAKVFQSSVSVRSYTEQNAHYQSAQQWVQGGGWGCEPDAFAAPGQASARMESKTAYEACVAVQLGGMMAEEGGCKEWSQ